MEKHFAFQIDADVHGMVTGGSLGEASTLSFDEKLEVTRIALNVANNRIPVLANVSETRTTNALRFVEQVAKMVQNLKLAEPMVGVGNEFVHRPSQPLVGAERERVSANLISAFIPCLDFCKNTYQIPTIQAHVTI